MTGIAKCNMLNGSSVHYTVEKNLKVLLTSDDLEQGLTAQY